MSQRMTWAESVNPPVVDPDFQRRQAAEGERLRRLAEAVEPPRLAILDGVDMPEVPVEEQRRLAALMVEGLGIIEPGLAPALRACHAFLTRYVRFPSPHEPIAATLWIAHAHAFGAAEVSPYLAITSAEKRSGKTRLLDCLEVLVPRPWRAITPSEAVTYRKIEADLPTLLLDEIDAVFGPRPSERTEGLRAILNAGNRRGTTVPRMTGEGKKMRVQDFAVYGPKALAGIGKLPDTVADRSIPVRLERRARGEAVERFRYREAKERAEPIRAALAEALEELTGRLAQSRPALPDSLGDRAADGWEPLLAVADAAGGKWPALAREAASALSGETTDDLDEASLHVLLLADCRAAFDRTGSDRLLTVALIEQLTSNEERPWREYGRNDRGITAHGVSRLLRGYGVRPDMVRIGTTVGRGYRRADFESAWSRYLPPATQSPIRNTATNGPSEHEPDVLTDPICNGVAAVTLPTGWEGDPELPGNDDGWPEAPAGMKEGS